MGIVRFVITEEVEVTSYKTALGEGVIVHFAFLQMEDVYLVSTNIALDLQLFGYREL